MNDQTGRTVDYDLHGLARIRLLDASDANAAAVGRQLGLDPGPAGREPDITIRFVGRLPIDAPVRFIGLNDAAFTDEDFLIFTRNGKSRAQLRFEQFGGPVEIVCEKSCGKVPLLIAALNLTLLGKGVLPLHASAFEYEGKGVVVTGWAKGGKTETLLAFLSRGAKYVGDEWVYFTPDGRIYGVPEPIRVWGWMLRDVPRFRARVPLSERARLQALRLLTPILEKGAPARLACRMSPILRRQLFVRFPPRRTFGAENCPLTGRPEKLILAMSHDRDEVRVERIDAEEAAARMLASLQFERQDLLMHYLKYRYAFPGRRSDLLEEAEAVQRELLRRALRGLPACAVYHPYPVALPSLFEALRPFVERAAEQSASGATAGMERR